MVEEGLEHRRWSAEARDEDEEATASAVRCVVDFKGRVWCGLREGVVGHFGEGDRRGGTPCGSSAQVMKKLNVIQ